MGEESRGSKAVVLADLQLFATSIDTQQPCLLYIDPRNIIEQQEPWSIHTKLSV